MRPEAIESDSANDKAGCRPLEVEDTTSIGQVRERQRKGKLWVLLAGAAILTILASAFGSLFLNHLPEQIGFFLVIVVILPAAVICEKLGFGHFNILGSSTVPDWLFFSVMIALVFVYSLVLVIIGRLMVRLLAGWRAER